MPSITAMNKKKPKPRKNSGQQKLSYPLTNEIIDQLIEQFQGQSAENLLGTDGLADQLKKQLAE